MSGMSVAAKNIVREIACMSYGSREGTKGGRGNLGLLKMSNGDFRIVKFNTHGEKSDGAAAITSSDNLRTLLHALSLEANLDQNTQTRINHLLQVSPEGAPRQGTKLLDRTITATVVELIAGKGIWKEVLAAYRKDKYTSASRTDFDTVKGGDGDVNTANARTLSSVGKHSWEKIVEFRETAKRQFYAFRGRIGLDIYGKVCDLMKKVVPKEGTFTETLAKMNCSSAELTDLMGRCALRLTAVKYGANHTAKETADFVKQNGLLGKCAPGSTAEDVLTDLEGVLKFCADNGEGEDNDALLISCLQEMMLEELTGSGASDDIHTTQVAFKGEVRDFTGSANALKALKAVLGKFEKQPEDVPPVQPRLRTISSAGKIFDDVAERVHERLRKLVEDNVLAEDDVRRLGGSPVEIKESVRRKLAKDKDLMPGPANIGNLIENLGRAARKSQKKDVVGNAVGFHTEFLRKMAASTVLDKYTINGKPVPVGEANVQALNGRTRPGKGGSTVKVSYSEDDGRDVSKNALAFMRQLEQHVQDPVKRHFLTLLMGMEDPAVTLAMSHPEHFGLDAGSQLGLVSRGYNPTIISTDDNRYDLSFEDGFAVLRTRVNVSPSLSRVPLPGGGDVTLGMGAENKSIPVLSNWYEITTRIDLSKPVDADGVPVFSQTVVCEKAKKTAYENMEMFARAADEHREAGDFYVRLSADGTRLESAGSRNILRGSASAAENNRVRDFLRECVIAYYGSEANIPAEVKAQMTNFNGGGHPLSAKRIGLIWNAIQLDRIGKMSPDELRDDPYVARTLMRNGRQFRSGDSTINEWNKALDMTWPDETDPGFFRTDCEQNVSPKAFLTCMKSLHDEYREGAGETWGTVLRSITSFTYGSGTRVSYKDLSEKQGGTPEAVRRRMENDIASFVTGGKVRDFRKLDRGQRNLALFLKANLNGKTAGLSKFGIHNRNFKYEGEGPSHYSVDFTSDGGLKFRYVKSADLTKVVWNGVSMFIREFDPADGKRHGYYEEVTVSYSKEEVENITKADFEALEKTFQQFGKKKNDQRDDATVEKDVREHLPKEFLVNPKVELNYAFDID